jgi:hypothetical protein
VSGPARLHLARACACAGEHEDGECHCHGAPRVGPGGGPAPELVYRALRAPGRPLEAPVRAEMEHRFGRDLGAVRIHAGDALSGASARAVGARAYTVGRDVVFGDPGLDSGGATLSHELAHVLQQDAREWSGEPLEVAPAHDPAEEEARAAEAHSARPLAVARQLAEAAPVEYMPPPVEFEPPPIEIEPPVEVEPEPVEVGPRGPIEHPHPAPRYIPPPRSIEEGMRRDAMRSKVRRDIAEAERPVATLERGGRQPTFVTVERTELGMWSWGNYRFRRRAFHVLDAIEYEVSRASTEQDLERILTLYIGVLGVDPAGRIRLPQLDITTGLGYDLPTYPANLDPGAKKRLEVFADAASRRTSNIPGLASVPAFVEIVGKPRKRGRCFIFPTASAGEDLDPLGALYCSIVTRSPLAFEWLVTTPEGEWVQFDALLGDTALECKCGYAGVAADAKSSDLTRNTRAERELSRRDEQMRRQSRVCAACNLKLRYYASNAAFAEVLNARWFGNPPVLWEPWSECP